MQRWEYKVISLRHGSYTAALNEYGQEGWELVSVASDDRDLSSPEPGRAIPMPRAIGRLEDAAAKLSKLGAAGSASTPAEQPSSLLWVLRRRLDEE